MAESNWLECLEDQSSWERLSPAAKAVTNAAASVQWEQDAGGMSLGDVQEIAAAALRAVVDQVVPDDPNEAMHFTTEAIRLNRMSIRAELLNIAAELEGSA